MLFFGAIFLLSLPYDVSPWSDVANVFWSPIPLFDYLHLTILPFPVLKILQIIWKVGLALSFVGLFTRCSTLISFGIGLYLLGLPQNFGKTHHRDAILVIVMGIMALSRCGDSWSIDKLLSLRRSSRNPDLINPRMSGDYIWPIRLVQVLIALIFFGAGISKIRRSSLEWIFSDNVRFILLERNKELGLEVAQYTWLFRLLAGATVVGEVSIPLALFNRPARLTLVPSLFMVQTGIILLMGINFKEFMICYIFWVPWDRIAQLLMPRVGAARKYVLLIEL